jgi:hypothetical protein
MPEKDLRNELLDRLAILFNKSGGNIQDFSLPQKTNSIHQAGVNCLFEEEISYDVNHLLDESEVLISQLNAQQFDAFTAIVDNVLNSEPKFYFVSGYGGTGKTFLWNAIVSCLRSKKIVLIVASSGVASLLLPSGHMTHSRFKIPCDTDATSTCNIKKGTMFAELIRCTSLIIWDEAFMTHRMTFEALDMTFRDLLQTNLPVNESFPFGGEIVVLGGDPRQILPVVEGGTRSQIVDAAIVNSPLRNSIHILKLTKNMRLYSDGLSADARLESTTFSKWLLAVGEGTARGPSSAIPTIKLR